MSESEPYAKHALLLAGKPVEVSDGKPFPGWYFLRHGGLRVPVSIYPHPDDPTKLLAYEGVAPAGAYVDPVAIWMQVNRNPISFETWEAVYDSSAWPDEPAGAAAEGDDEAPAQIGHNVSDDPLENLADLYRDLVEHAQAVINAGVGDAAAADRAANLGDRLSALKGEVDAAYRGARRPHEAVLEEVRDRWRPLVDGIPAIKQRLREALAAYLKAEKDRREAEARELVKAGAPIEEAAPQPVRVGGAGGRRTSLRTTRTGEITDYAAFLEAIKDRPEIHEAAQSVANALARAAVTMPGMTIRTKTG